MGCCYRYSTTTSSREREEDVYVRMDGHGASACGARERYFSCFRVLTVRVRIGARRSRLCGAQAAHPGCRDKTVCTVQNHHIPVYVLIVLYVQHTLNTPGELTLFRSRPAFTLKFWASGHEPLSKWRFPPGSIRHFQEV